MSELRIDRVVKSYGRVPVLNEASLLIEPGAVTAILGSSGCGKTTLLRLIAGFDRVDGGTIELDGRLLSAGRRHVAPHRRGIGYVAQEGALFPHLSVRENILFGLDWGQRRRRARVEELLEIVSLDPALATRRPHELSGGQQQRVALARALAPRPSLILLDEPFSALDAGLRAATRSAVAAALRDAKVTALLVTHDQGEALSFADQLAVMQRGQVVQSGPGAELYTRPVDVETARTTGPAITLPGRRRGDVVDCALGELPIADAIADSARDQADGPCTVMVRPEQITLGQPGSGGADALVRSVEYYGAQHMVHLALATDDARVSALITGSAAPRAGDRVSVRVDEPVLAFAP